MQWGIAMHYLDNTIESLGKIFVNLLCIIYCKSPTRWRQGFSDSQKEALQTECPVNICFRLSWAILLEGVFKWTPQRYHLSDASLYNNTLPIWLQNVIDNCLCDGDSNVVSLTLCLGFFIY